MKKGPLNNPALLKKAMERSLKTADAAASGRIKISSAMLFRLKLFSSNIERLDLRTLTSFRDEWKQTAKELALREKMGFGRQKPLKYVRKIVTALTLLIKHKKETQIRDKVKKVLNGTAKPWLN